jgi:hypothetical protein
LGCSAATECPGDPYPNLFSSTHTNNLSQFCLFNISICLLSFDLFLLLFVLSEFQCPPVKTPKVLQEDFRMLEKPEENNKLK